MPTAAEAIEAAIREVTTARALVKKIHSKQVRTADTIDALKATALAWFNTHRPVVTNGGIETAAADAPYTTVLNSTAKLAACQTYLGALDEAKAALVGMRATALVAPPIVPASATDDVAPDFSPLAGNPEMREILTRRWHECCKCVKAQAHLAAIVMMGGLLEALFVSRANKMPVKDPLINATSAPKDKTTGKTVSYQNWMLDSYIKVAYELKWITESAKQVADTLKEYRNYIHPEKELRHGVVLSLNDSSMFWQVTKELVRQLLMSAANP